MAASMKARPPEQMSAASRVRKAVTLFPIALGDT
jgi:hypothetical protein